MLADKTASIDTCLNQGNAFIIFGFDITGKKYITVACILFSADPSRIWVNWLVVTKQLYNRESYGEKAANTSFCKCGFGKILL